MSTTTTKTAQILQVYLSIEGAGKPKTEITTYASSAAAVRALIMQQLLTAGWATDAYEVKEQGTSASAINSALSASAYYSFDVRSTVLPWVYANAERVDSTPERRAEAKKNNEWAASGITEAAAAAKVAAAAEVQVVDESCGYCFGSGVGPRHGADCKKCNGTRKKLAAVEVAPAAEVGTGPYLVTFHHHTGAPTERRHESIGAALDDVSECGALILMEDREAAPAFLATGHPVPYTVRGGVRATLQLVPLVPPAGEGPVTFTPVVSGTDGKKEVTVYRGSDGSTKTETVQLLAAAGAAEHDVAGLAAASLSAGLEPWQRSALIDMADTPGTPADVLVLLMQCTDEQLVLAAGFQPMLPALLQSELPAPAPRAGRHQHLTASQRYAANGGGY
jgi:hypothetical protein